MKCKLMTNLNQLKILIKNIIKENIGMFHDPRMTNHFKSNDDAWENGTLWVRIKMLKNIMGIKEDKIAEKYAIELESKSWEEVNNIIQSISNANQ